jgi:putative Ca2+/H+ antiporter (TMEM165/GDT1 family)
MAQAAREAGETDSRDERVRAGTHVGIVARHRPREFRLEAFLVSLGAVALAEIGDKTQLLSLVLAAKFRKPWPICGGILVASLLSHAIAAELGAWLAHWMTPEVQRWLIGLSFLAVAAWALLPEKVEPVDAPPRRRRGVFVASVIAVFIAE